MMAALRNFARDESAGALIEYALVLALVSMAGYAALATFGDALVSFFMSSSTGLEGVAERAQ